jgi:hypothetical protein
MTAGFECHGTVCFCVWEPGNCHSRLCSEVKSHSNMTIVLKTHMAGSIVGVGTSLSGGKAWGVCHARLFCRTHMKPWGQLPQSVPQLYKMLQWPPLPRGCVPRSLARDSTLSIHIYDRFSLLIRTPQP